MSAGAESAGAPEGIRCAAPAAPSWLWVAGYSGLARRWRSHLLRRMAGRLPARRRASAGRMAAMIALLDAGRRAESRRVSPSPPPAQSSRSTTLWFAIQPHRADTDPFPHWQSAPPSRGTRLTCAAGRRMTYTPPGSGKRPDGAGAKLRAPERRSATCPRWPRQDRHGQPPGNGDAPLNQNGGHTRGPLERGTRLGCIHRLRISANPPYYAAQRGRRRAPSRDDIARPCSRPGG